MLIRPVDYARRRGLSPSTVSRQIAAGKIPVHSGLIDPQEADAARRANLSPLRVAEAARRKSAGRSAPSTDERGAIGKVVAGLGRLPEAVRLMGAPDAAVLVIGNVADRLIWDGLGDAAVERLFGAAGIPPVVNAPDTELCVRVGVEYNSRLSREAEQLLDFVLSRLYPREAA